MDTTASSRASLGVLVALLGLGACSGEEDDGVTYAGDVRLIFDDRCVFCHQPGAPYGPETGQGLDFANPYAEEGVVNAVNFWAGPAHPEFPAKTVTIGDPEASFLIFKISDPELGYLPSDGSGGGHMPLQIPPMLPEEVALVEQWVMDGAPNDDSFRCDVLYMFMPTIPLATECNKRFMPGFPGKCDSCHFAGTPYPPDLSDPFGPDGLVGVRSNYRSDLLRVEPGSPDRSLLVQKLRASANGNLPSSEFGAPMPRPVLPLSNEQVDLIRQWILEGARP